MIILEKFDPVIGHAERGARALHGPVRRADMFIAVLKHDLFTRFDFSSLRTGFMAGSPCPVAVMRQVWTRLYMKDITICFGLTESSR